MPLLFDMPFEELQSYQGRNPRPADFDTLMARGQGVAGTPATVTRFLRDQLDETGCNYVVGQFAFGDLTREQVLRSIDLFTNEVMPALRSREVRARAAADIAAQGAR